MSYNEEEGYRWWNVMKIYYQRLNGKNCALKREKGCATETEKNATATVSIPADKPAAGPRVSEELNSERGNVKPLLLRC
jgi:hypothetical protein